MSSTRNWQDNIKTDRKFGGRVWTGFMQLRMGSVEHDNKPSVIVRLICLAKSRPVKLVHVNRALACQCERGLCDESLAAWV